MAFGVLPHGLLSGTFSNRVIADEKQITISQLAIAWLLNKREDMITLVGTSRLSTLQSSLEAMDVKLSYADIERIENAISEDKIAGNIFPDAHFKNGVLVNY